MNIILRGVSHFTLGADPDQYRPAIYGQSALKPEENFAAEKQIVCNVTTIKAKKEKMPL